MDPIDLLEKRIQALELQILPNYQIDEKTPQITDLLLQTQTMISSALSCRDAITSILQHMTIINDYLDPNNGENDLAIEAKRQDILELYPELRDMGKMIATFKPMIKYTESESILKVTELTGKLESLSSANLQIFEESQEVTQETVRTLQRYNDIITSLKVLFSQMNQSLTNLEVALKSKVTIED